MHRVDIVGLVTGVGMSDETKLRELTVDGRRSIAVDARIYPMLMEWEWSYDAQFAQPVRREEGRVIPIYTEQIRLLRHDNTLPLLPHTAFRTMFSHLPAYGTLLDLSRRQRTALLDEYNLDSPPIAEVAADLLAHVLSEYWVWRDAGILHLAPEDRTLPGPLTEVPLGELAFESLGEWLRNEFTGEWVPNRRAPAGVIPETQRRVAIRRAWTLWRQHFLDHNLTDEETPPVKEIEAFLKAADVSVFTAAHLLVEVVSAYPL